jgi:hypothetical protein
MMSMAFLANITNSRSYREDLWPVGALEGSHGQWAQ